jgi:hypothetical protein
MQRFRSIKFLFFVSLRCRAARPKSHEKLLVFFYALHAANLLSLADSAKEILQGLGAKFPETMPTVNE